MKIVFLSDDFPPESFGGAGISTYELAKGMREKGHEVFVITTCRNSSGEGKFTYDNLTVFKVATNYHPRWRAYLSLYNRPVVSKVEGILKEIRPDVVHANNIHFYLSYHCLKVARKYGRAVIITLRDTMTVFFGKIATERYHMKLDAHVTWFDNFKKMGKRWNPVFNFCVRRYLRYVDRIVAISKSLKGAMEQNGISDIDVIYNGIDVMEWGTHKPDPAEFCRRYGLEDKKVILFSGRLSAAKGGAKLLEALPEIVRAIPNTVLLVAGTEDDYARAMKAYAKRLHVDLHLFFTGWINRNDMKNVYAISDVVMMPSIYLDSFGRVNIEAMAARKPVVGTRYGGTPEIVVDGVTGYIVNPLYPEEIARRTIELLQDPQKARKYGEAGYERLTELFNLEDKVNEYIHMYESILDQETRRDIKVL